jgi:cell wall-associated NlpC family hydrolase
MHHRPAREDHDVTISRQAIRTAATFVVAVFVVISSLLVAAPAAQAAPHNTNFTEITNTNWNTFKKGKGKYFTISVKLAPCRNCAGIPGKAQLKLDGKHKKFRKLDHGSVTFRVSRSQLRDNRWVEVAVRTWPHRDGRPSKVVKFNVKDVPKPKKKTGRGAKIVAAAKTKVGDNYRLGATGPNIWDCSSFVRFSVKKATGKTLPRSSAEQKNSGRRVSRAQARPGDLVYVPGHIAVYAGNGRVIEAATPKTGVVIRGMWQRSPVFIRV